jgi:hypothetical protein
MPTERICRTRFFVTSVLASASGVLGIITLFWHDWLEACGLNLDRGDGSVERMVVVGLMTVAALLGVAAVAQWRSIFAHQT